MSLEISTLCGWVGATAAALKPLVDTLATDILGGDTLHVDDTPVPVLAPGTGKTKTGRLWTYVRDERPFGGSRKPAALFFYSPDRKGEHPQAHLRDFRGVIHADGYAGVNELFVGGRIVEAGCRVGGGVAIPAPHRPGRADFPHPVLRAQASLTGRRIGGRSRLAAVDIDRAWPGSVSTADGCGVRVGRAISSRSAGAGGGTSEPAGRFP